jgi:hypothetical protein
MKFREIHILNQTGLIGWTYQSDRLRYSDNVVLV